MAAAAHHDCTMASLEDPFSRYFVEARLPAGAAIYLRAVCSGDGERLRTFFQRLSPESMRLRFHGGRGRLSDDEIARLTSADFVDHAALAATCAAEPTTPIVAVAEYLRAKPPDLNRAEVALAVLDEYQGHGIGALCLAHLAIIAQAHKLQEFEANVLAANRRAIEIFEHSGFQLTHATDQGVVRMLLTIAPATPKPA